MKEKSKYRIGDPELNSAFLRHCESGFSPRMFIPRIIGASTSYTLLYKTDKEFKEINDRFKKRSRPKIY